MNLYVREYSWMWNDLRLSLAECRVYAYIYGLTHGEKGGYDGSKRHLAELLGLPKSTAFDALDTLTEKHLIVCTDGLWKSVRQPDIESVRPAPESVRPTDENGRSADSPHTPLNNNIKIKKQADMQTDFEKFFDKFTSEFKNRHAATEMLWEHRSAPAQQAMWDEVKDEQNGSVNKNPYFFVQDFPEPQPTFLRGDEGGDIVQVFYNGTYKLCTRATMELFGLQWVRDW